VLPKKKKTEGGQAATKSQKNPGRGVQGLKERIQKSEYGGKGTVSRSARGSLSTPKTVLQRGRPREDVTILRGKGMLRVRDKEPRRAEVRGIRRKRKTLEGKMRGGHEKKEEQRQR